MLKQGQKVLVDNEPGIISEVYPEGKGQYQGKLHAYYWVRTPHSDYLGFCRSGQYGRMELVYRENGRAVNFKDMQRIKVSYPSINALGL
jgi:hypothetical protein